MVGLISDEIKSYELKLPNSWDTLKVGQLGQRQANTKTTRKSCSETNTKAALRYRQSTISNLI